MTTDPKDTEIARLTAERDQARAEAAKWHADANLMLGFADLAYEVGAMPTSSELIAASDRALAAHANAARAEAIKRAEKAEAALSDSQAREAALHHAITEASEPDFIWGAMDNVNDMDADLDEFAKAASRAIRAAVPTPADAEAALPAASQPEAEPVAWYWTRGNDLELTLLRDGEYGKRLKAGGFTEVPLYAHPVQEPPSSGVTAGATGVEQVAWPGPGRFTDLPKKLRRAAQLVFADDLTEGWRQWISDTAEDAALKIEALERDLATPAPVVPAEGLDALIEAAKAEAEKAMSKFPQPNYVISKVAEEAGEVVKAAIHCAEGRETQENVVSEIRQAMAMLFRLYLEGDQVHGLPPLRAQQPAPPGSGVTVQEAGWRPIETAPKNGAFILAIASMTGHRGYSIICWDDDGWGGYTADDERRLVKFPPAYWMPLPEPPAHESPQ